MGSEKEEEEEGKGEGVGGDEEDHTRLSPNFRIIRNIFLFFPSERRFNYGRPGLMIFFI